MSNRDKLLKEIELRKQIKRVKAREDFWCFCLYMDKDFFTERKKVLKPIAEDMQRLIKPKTTEEELDILNVSLPPRTGKSYLCTLFCTWALGNLPTESIMRNTVTATLYQKFSKDAKRIMMGNSHKGRYLEVFSDIEFESTNIDGWTLRGNKQGVSYFGNGIEGAIIGFGATLLSIVDDSVKGEDDALNEESLEKKWRWYTSEQDSREEKGCKKLFIGTRWSKRDIVGRLESKGLFDGERSKMIAIPAIDNNGRSYCESIHTTDKLLEKKKLCSDIIWEAEWMQNPIEAKGLLYPITSLKRFKLCDIEGWEYDGIVGFTDVADKGKDFLCSLIGKRIGKYTYITDVIYTQEPVEITEPLLSGMIIDTKCDIMRIESNNMGRIYARNIRSLIEGKSNCSIIPMVSKANKETRILLNSAYVKDYFIFRDDYPIGSHYDLFMRAFTSYTARGKNKNDDSVDAATGLAMFMKSFSFPKKIEPDPNNPTPEEKHKKLVNSMGGELNKRIFKW